MAAVGWGGRRQRQLRIEQRQLRIEVGAVHPLFLLELLPDEDGREGHLAPRPGGRRNHDLGESRTGNLVESEVILRLPLVRREDGDRLGEVHRAPAPDADDAVALLPEGQLRPLVGQFERRLRRRLVVKDVPDLRLLHEGGDLPAKAGPGQVPVEDDQRPAHLQLREVLRQAGETPVSEHDLFGARKRKCLHGHCSMMMSSNPVTIVMRFLTGMTAESQEILRSLWSPYHSICRQIPRRILTSRASRVVRAKRRRRCIIQ